MRYLKDLVRPYGITLSDVDDAIAKSIDAIIFGGLSREVAACHAAFMPDLCMLPLGHLADHRMAGVWLPPIHAGSTQLPADTLEAARRRIVEWLGHLLNTPNWPGARDIVAEALGLDPTRDAAELIRLGRLEPSLFEALTGGGLGRSIQLIRAGKLERHKDDILQLATRLLMYFGAFSAQIVAARAWSYNHLPFRHPSGAGDYRIDGVANDLANIAETLEKICQYALKQSVRGPNNGLRYDVTRQAQQWQAAVGGGTIRQRADAVTFFSDAQRRINNASRKLKTFNTQAERSRETVHKWVFGISAAEALAFTVSRLIQLRDAAPALIHDGAAGLPFQPLRLARRELPHQDSVDVSNILYVLRITILSDRSGSIVDDPKAEKPEFAGRGVDLRDMLLRPRPSGNKLNSATLKDMRTKFNNGFFVRRRHVHGPLKAHEALDVIPEFWLQVGPSARVRPAPAVTVTPLSLKRLRIPRDKRGRPPNGYDQSG